MQFDQMGRRSRSESKRQIVTLSLSDEQATALCFSGGAGSILDAVFLLDSGCGASQVAN